MLYNQDILEELNILMRYNLDTTLTGIKIHHSSADPTLIAAAQRLYSKGLITQADGGYLTPMGHEAAEQAQMLLGLLTPLL